MNTPGHGYPTLMLLLVLAAGCSWPTDDKTSKRTLTGDVVITTNTVWSNETVEIEGTLSVTSGATLTLSQVTLILNPEVEDTGSFVITAANLIATGSRIQSGSGKQWNLEATGASVLNFTDTAATDHTGIRVFDDGILTARGSEIEEVQCHDNATLNILDGSAVYLVLFFDNTGSVSLPNGTLAAGDNLTRSFDYTSSATTQGHLVIADSDVWGFQLDLVGGSALSVSGGTEIVLALHLDSVGTLTVSNSITSNSPATGSLAFGSGQPSFQYINTQISFINTYVSGASDVTFSGTIRVVEANVWDGAKLTFGAGTSLLADLAQAYDTAILTLNGVTLITDDSNPSFTAMDQSVVRINQVAALPETVVYAVDDGRVEINQGSGWNESMFERIDGGTIIVTP